MNEGNDSTASGVSSLPSRIRIDYESGHSLIRIATNYGLGVRSVRQHIVDAGGEIRPAHPRKGSKRGDTIQVTIDYDLMEKLNQWCELNHTKPSVIINVSLDWFFTLIDKFESVRWDS